MGRRDELRRELTSAHRTIARSQRRIRDAERELEELDALPDFEAMAAGTVLALTVQIRRLHSFAPDQPVPVIALKDGRGRWHVTGYSGAMDSGRLVDWLTEDGRRLIGAMELAVLEQVKVQVVHLDQQLLDLLQDTPRVSEFCELPNCYCDGDAH